MNSLIIVSDFSFTRNFRQIKWGATIGYNLLRAACAGLVLAIFLFILPQDSNALSSAIVAPLVWPIIYLVFFLPLGIVLNIFQWLPLVGSFAAFCAFIAVSIGDPVVSLIYKLNPKIVQVESPPLFSLTLIYWVLDAPRITVAR